jgi:hypothetical protein
MRFSLLVKNKKPPPQCRGELSPLLVGLRIKTFYITRDLFVFLFFFCYKEIYFFSETMERPKLSDGRSNLFFLILEVIQ